MSNHVDAYIRFGNSKEDAAKFTSVMQNILDNLPHYLSLPHADKSLVDWHLSNLLDKYPIYGYHPFDREAGELYYSYNSFSDIEHFGHLAQFISSIVPDTPVHFYIAGDVYMPYNNAHWVILNGDNIQGGWAKNYREGMALLEMIDREEPRCSACEHFEKCLPIARMDGALDMCDPEYDPKTDPRRYEDEYSECNPE